LEERSLWHRLPAENRVIDRRTSSIVEEHRAYQGGSHREHARECPEEPHPIEIPGSIDVTGFIQIGQGRNVHELAFKIRKRKHPRKQNI
jgi:hypothetical protein